jgi:phage host-nuclease inhibitor protein Gam
MLINGKEVDARQLQSDWALALMSQGIVVKLGVTRWRAKSSLTAERLGLKFSDKDSADFMRKYVNLGKYLLLPPSIITELDGIEGKARSVLRHHSFDTVWGHFVPFSAFEQWEQENKAIRAEYMDAARALGEKYDAIIQNLRHDYRSLAKDVWARLYPHDTSGATESFIQDFVDKIIAQIPSSTDIVASFRYDAVYFVIPMPSFVEENISRARSVQREREIADRQANLEQHTRRRIAEEYVNRKKELIDGFLEATVTSLRQYVSEFCDSVLQSLGKRSKTGMLNAKDVKKIKNMIQKVKLLNFYDDQDIARLLKDLGNEIDKIKGEIDNDTVAQKLRAIVSVGAKEFIPTNFNPAISYLEV